MTELDDVLARAALRLDELQDELARLFFEHINSLDGSSYAELLRQVDAFVSDVFVRLELRSRQTGDLLMAQRLERATVNILATVRGTSLPAEQRASVAELVAGLERSGSNALGGVVGIGVGAVLVYAAIVLLVLRR